MRMSGDTCKPFREPGGKGVRIVGVTAKMGIDACLEEPVGAAPGLFIVDAGETAEVALEFCSYLYEIGAEF